MANQASMGPRSFDRGKSFLFHLLGDVNDKLQWGRDLSIAERIAKGKAWRIAAGFNGAAIFRSRKVDVWRS